MKLTHIIPIAAVVAGCSTVEPPKSQPPMLPSQASLLEKYRDSCIKGVETLLTFPFGDGVLLEMRRPDNCADPLGAFIYTKKIERRGQLILGPVKNPMNGTRMVTLQVLAGRSINGGQEVMIGGKIEKGKTGQILLNRIDEIDTFGSIERQ